MSNQESFIDEVTEEVRKERLYGLIRRWGWIPVLAVLLLVGGAAWTEWQRNAAETRAEAFGDAALAALEMDDAEARRAALAEIEPAEDGHVALLALLEAATASGAEDTDAVRDGLLALADTGELSATYAHLALLKALLAGGTGDADRNALLLEELAAPGAPYRPLAIELQAMAALEAGEEETALTLLRSLMEEAEATEALRRRALQLIVALGASPDPA